MYEFSDAIDKVNFDEEFSDVADNIKNDCRQLESINFSDAVVKINEWIDKVFNLCNCSTIDYPEWFRIVVWRVLYNEIKANPQARQTELIENNINLPKDVFGKKYWNMYSPDMKLQQERYNNLFLPFNYAQVECNPIYRAMIHHIICRADICADNQMWAAANYFQNKMNSSTKTSFLETYYEIISERYQKNKHNVPLSMRDFKKLFNKKVSFVAGYMTGYTLQSKSLYAKYLTIDS